MTNQEYTEKLTRLSLQLARATSTEEKARLTNEMTTLAQRAPTATNGRRAEFETSDADEFNARGFDVRVKSLYTRPARTDAEREVSTILDDALIVASLLRCKPSETRLWQDAMETNATFRKSMGTSDAANWIPTEISAELHKQVRLECRVASLLRSITMPAPTYVLPVQGNPPKAYLASEQTDTDAETDESKKAKPSDVGLGDKAQLTARKLAVRCIPSVELTEDSIVAALPEIREQMIRALAEGIEQACVNGKRVGTLDSDVTDSADTRHAWDGLRQFAVGSSYGNNQAVFAAATAGRIEVGDLRKARQLMGKYSIRPQDNALFCSVLGYTQLLGVCDANGNQLVLTRDKAGVNATLFEGALASIDGWPIVVTEGVRDDLNRVGYYDGITTDSTMLLLVNRRQFVVGSYRNPTLKSKEIIDTDQLALVLMARMDFTGYVPTEPAVSIVYGIHSV